MQCGQYSFVNIITLLPFIISCALKDSSTFLGFELDFMIEVILMSVDRLAVAAVFAEEWFLGGCTTQPQIVFGGIGVEFIGAVVAAVIEEPNPGLLAHG